MITSKTGRGFEIIEFLDDNGVDCSMQQSSAIRCLPSGEIPEPGTSLLWLGPTEANPLILASRAKHFGIETDETTGWVPYPVPEEVLFTTRAHLDRDMVETLVARLQHWLDTGNILLADD